MPASAHTQEALGGVQRQRPGASHSEVSLQMVVMLPLLRESQGG